MTEARFRGLSGTALKLIAAASMTADHVGYMLFPKLRILRIVGRLALPVFAYLIAEGMRHTRSPLRYFLRLLLFGAACQAVYTVATRDFYMNILVTFSLSVLIMIPIRLMRDAEEKNGPDANRRAVYLSVSAAAVAGAFLLCRFVTVDYGFWGVILPVSAFVFTEKKKNLLLFSVFLALMSADFYFSGLMRGGAPLWVLINRESQPFSLLALPLLALYNGKRGKWRLKYFFYVFYPAHLGLIYLIGVLTGLA